MCASVAPRSVRADEPGRSELEGALLAGPTGFVDPQSRALLSTGAALELRVGAECTRWIWYELTYAASLHTINDPEIATGTMRGMSVELGVRINLTSTAARPYVAAGLGETYYRVTGWRANTTMSILDYVTHVPIAVGISGRRGRTFFDLRGSYRFAFDVKLIDGEHDRLDTWRVVVGAGFEL